MRIRDCNSIYFRFSWIIQTLDQNNVFIQRSTKGRGRDWWMNHSVHNELTADTPNNKLEKTYFYGKINNRKVWNLCKNILGYIKHSLLEYTAHLKIIRYWVCDANCVGWRELRHKGTCRVSILGLMPAMIFNIPSKHFTYFHDTSVITALSVEHCWSGLSSITDRVEREYCKKH